MGNVNELNVFYRWDENILNLDCALGGTTLNKHKWANCMVSEVYLKVVKKKKRWGNGREFAGNQYL